MTKLWIIGPEIRASRPITTFNRSFPFEACLIFKNEPYADANFTASTGVKLSPTAPPIVPLIPDIDFINVILYKLILNYKYKRCSSQSDTYTTIFFIFTKRIY